MADSSIFTTDIGAVTAYADAKEHGYTGTREEFGTLLANAGTNLAEANAAKNAAKASENAAKASKDAAAKSANAAAASSSNAGQSAEAAENAAERAEAAAGVNPSDYYTKQQADAAFATAAQGQFAQTSMQSVWVAGVGQVLNKESQKIDLLNVDISVANGQENAPYFFGSDSPSSDLVNSPYTASPFYGYRQTLVSKYGGTNTSHLTMVIIFELYPVPGRIWGNTYDKSSKSWIGWKQNGV